MSNSRVFGWEGKLNFIRLPISKKRKKKKSKPITKYKNLIRLNNLVDTILMNEFSQNLKLN